MVYPQVVEQQDGEQRPRRGLADWPILGALLRPWTRDLDVVALRHENRINLLEERMTAMDNALTEAARLVGLARAELASLRDQLTAEQTDDQAQVDAAREADANRLTEVIAALAEVLPAPVPEVPTPAPGEPAQDPDSGQTTDEVLADQGSSDTL